MSTEDAAPATTSRDQWRQELAEILELDPAVLTDDARLIDDLGLDSLALMSIRAWLDGKGITTSRRQALQRVGDALTLAERVPEGNRISLLLGAAPGRDDLLPDPSGAAGVPDLGPPASGSPLAPTLSNRAYRLTPVTDGDLEFLYELAVHPETGFRWRYRGAPPQPERFAANLWNQVLVQYVARDIASGQPAGLVAAFSADFTQGHACIGSVFLPEHAGTGLAADITAVFVRYLFHVFSLRKLYLEVPGFNWPQVSSGAGRLFQVEGVLRDHDFYAGRYWDQYVCAIYRPQT